MSGALARLRRAWDEFVGPEATPVNHVLTAATTVAGAVTAPLVARRRGADRGRAAVACVLATDLAGGVYVNNTLACARWYERPGQGNTTHLAFAALHVHPAAVAWLDVGAGARKVPGPAWAAAHYAYLMAATVVVRRFPSGRRPLGVVLTAGGLVLDGLLGPSHRAPWFAWTFYPKLLMGHAGASLWSDDALRLVPEYT
ncbi:hypothetical protein SAMN05444695_110128 [Rhodococcus triatomae]|uniref:Uncharacterized protein n=1 Tax=Rhodococcus triatomae TaxID=300028 RepID=A0A1G8MZ93_9NOCA|nr:hypothetical protein [Rhodococcus triatomae]QNG19133.1 hypothetical protein G4H72_10795 [Rhodococcus triatomae]SDI73196.1 hypothetical protein SAMN05444695_110128 [Rhodococcus triatomae]